LIVRSARKILGDLVPAVTVLANGLQEELVLLERPPPLSKRGIERVDPALAAGLVRSAVDEFGNLYPIDLFTGGWNADYVEGRQDGGMRGCGPTVCADCTDKNFVFATSPFAF